MAPRLTMAFTNNPRVQPLKDGTVKPENIDPEYVTNDAGALFYRNLKYDEFEAPARRCLLPDHPGYLILR